jgi:hypothetical protein
MSKHRNTKKAKRTDDALHGASIDEGHDRKASIEGREHLFYKHPGVRVDHLSPRARKLLGVRAF